MDPAKGAMKAKRWLMCILQVEELAAISAADAKSLQPMHLEPKVISEVDPKLLGFTYTRYRSRFVSVRHGQVLFKPCQSSFFRPVGTYRCQLPSLQL